MIIKPGQTNPPVEEPEKDYTSIETTNSSGAPTVPGWPAKDGTELQPLPSNMDQTSEIQWSASEFVEHQKNGEWYLAVFLGGAIITGLLYLITGEIISVVVVALAVSLFAISGSRKPKTLNYQITSSGVIIGSKIYPFINLKSFSVIDDGAISSITLWPLKRFTPSITIYYPPDQEEAIFETLSGHLPHEQKKREAVDALMKRIRF